MVCMRTFPIFHGGKHRAHGPHGKSNGAKWNLEYQNGVRWVIIFTVKVEKMWYLKGTEISFCMDLNTTRLSATLNNVNLVGHSTLANSSRCPSEALTTDHSSFSGCGFIFRFYYFSKPNSQIAVKVWIKWGFFFTNIGKKCLKIEQSHPISWCTTFTY